MKKLLLFFLSLLGFTIGFAQTPALVKDINTIHTSLGGVEETITYNGYVYFIQDDGTNGSEVWRTDGTTTAMFTNIDNATFGDPYSLTVWNGNLYFSTDITGVWKSDGTTTSSFTTATGTIIPAATKLYLQDGYSLKITDGTSEALDLGTLPLAGLGGWQFTTLADGLFYSGKNDAVYGTELIYEDGIVANPPVVIDIYPGTDGSFPGSFTVYNNKLHFMAVRKNDPYGATNNGNGAKTLYESDGTIAGTVGLVDFGTYDATSSRWAAAIGMTVFGGKLFYYNITGGSTSNTILTNYDGTTHTDIHTFTNLNIISAFINLYFKSEINGVLYFSATDNKILSSWETDGISVIASAINLTTAFQPTQLGAEIFYSSGNLPAKLFSTDLSGTVTEIYDYSNSSDFLVKGLTILGGNLFFIATQDTDGSQLWKTDGTTTTQISSNGITSSNGSNPTPLFELGGNMYFSADNGVDGVQLYKTDGTEGNTTVVGSTIPASGGVLFNSEYYYATNNILWKTDGAAFTNLFTLETAITQLTTSGANLFFVTTTAAEGEEVWVSDGTATHTVIDKAAGGIFNTYPQDLVDVNGTLYFTGIDLNKGTRGLWKSDGTDVGTTVVYSGDYDISNLTKYNDKLYFVLDDLFNGIEPKLYDTTNDSFIDFDLNASGDSEPHDFEEMNGDMYFFTKSPRALWKSDGTVNGTVSVYTLANPDAYNPNATPYTVFASSNKLYFYYYPGSNSYGHSGWYAYNGTTMGVFSANISSTYKNVINDIVYYISSGSLMETDGTNEGTKMILVGDYANLSNELSSFNNELYFKYDDGLLGHELYKYKSDKQGFALTANTALTITANTEIDLTFDWLAGNGDGRIVLISTVENMALPVDGETYTANTVYGASALGSSTNTFVIGNGATATTDVTGLTYGTTYYISIIEYTEPTPGNFLFDRQSILRTTYLAPKIDQTISLTAIPAKTYGDASFPIEATATSGQAVTYTIVSGPGTISGSTLFITGAGDIVFDANVAANATYNAATLQTTVPVAKVPLTATVSDESRAYGAANSAFTVVYNGFIASQDATVLDAAPIPSTLADAISNAGSYAITMSTGSDNNYEITNVEGTLTVTQAALTANVNSESKIYGEINPAFTIAYTGFANAENESVIDTHPTVSTLADATTSTGSFAIVASGGVDNNYEISSNEGILTINKASLSAVINDQERAYGEQNAAVTFTYTGFVNNDTDAAIDTPPGVATSADNLSDVGTYDINASNTGSDNNYNISFPTSGTLTIIKADQIITLDAITDQDYSISNQVFVTSSITSSLQVALSVTGPAVFANGFITLDETPGTVTVLANQVGDSNHNSATEVSVSFEAFTSDPCFNFVVTLVSSTFNTCNGASTASIDVSVTGGDGNYTYSWSSGEDTEDLANISAGTYTITVTDGNNCSGTVSTTITDPDPVQTPVITAQVENQSQPFLIINNMSEVGYEWFKNGVSVQNGSSNQLFITEEGSYSVIAFNSIGCASAESEAAVIVITGFENGLSSNEISFYPNPVNDKLTLEMGADFSMDKGAKVIITDVSGKEVYNRNYSSLNSRKTEVDMSSYESGIYLVRVINGDKIAQYKIRKQ